MTRDRLRNSAPLGVAVGVVVAIVAWWALFALSAVIGEASGTLGEPSYPLLPRLLLVGVVASSVGVLLMSRAAAATAGLLAVCAVGYSALATLEIAPDLAGVAESWSIAAAPGDGYRAGPLGLARELVNAVASGAAHLPLLLLAGAWAAMAASTFRKPSEVEAGWRGVSRRPQGWGLLLVGVVAAVAAWWLLAVAGRALTSMLIDGRAAFSIAPPLVLFMLSALSVGAMLRWPRMALGAVVTVMTLLVISLLVADPVPGLRISPSSGWWSISLQDLLRATANGAFAPASLVLASAWVTIALLRHRLSPAIAERAPAVATISAG